MILTYKYGIVLCCRLQRKEREDKWKDTRTSVGKLYHYQADLASINYTFFHSTIKTFKDILWPQLYVSLLQYLKLNSLKYFSLLYILHLVKYSEVLCKRKINLLLFLQKQKHNSFMFEQHGKNGKIKVVQ